MLPHRPVKMKSTGLKAKLDKIFSQYIRLRDALPGGEYFRCISCGKIKKISQADCGHFISRYHLSTRFDEDNCHAECKYCNRFDGNHLLGYRVNLIRKIGQKRYDLLFVKKNRICKISDFEYQALIKHYKDKINQLNGKSKDGQKTDGKTPECKTGEEDKNR